MLEDENLHKQHFVTDLTTLYLASNGCIIVKKELAGMWQGQVVA
jgi:hypothetical protein